MSVSRLSLPWEIFSDIQRLLTSWSLTVLEHFPPVLATGHFLRAAVINGTQATWIEVPVSSGDHVVIKENVHKAAAVFHAHLWFLGASRALGQAGFLDYEIEWNVPDETGKGLSLATYSP